MPSPRARHGGEGERQKRETPDRLGQESRLRERVRNAAFHRAQVHRANAAADVVVIEHGRHRYRDRGAVNVGDERVKPLLDHAFERLMSLGLRNVHFRFGDGTVAHLHLTWTGVGPFSGRRDRLFADFPNYRSMTKESGRSRSANASGATQRTRSQPGPVKRVEVFDAGGRVTETPAFLKAARCTTPAISWSVKIWARWNGRCVTN